MIHEAKLFKNGASQAVRLPKECRFDGESVYAHKVGRAVILVPRDDPWAVLEQAADLFTDDFALEREQGELQQRESF